MKLIQSTHAYNIVQLELQNLGLLPSEVLVGEVAVSGRGVVDGVRQVELLDDDSRAQVKVIPDNLDKLLRRLLRGSVRLDKERQRLGNADGI